jgi:hypothetical protein
VGSVERRDNTLSDESVRVGALAGLNARLDVEGGGDLVSDRMILCGNGIVATTQRREEKQSEFHVLGG